MELLGAKWTEVAQLGISVVGFVVVIIQIYYLKRTIQGDTHSKLYEHYLEVNKLLLDKPYLRPYFYDNKLLDEKDPEVASRREEVGMMCEITLGLLEHAVLQRANMPSDSWINCWRTYTSERFQKSCELVFFFENNRKWYAKALCDVINNCDTINNYSILSQSSIIERGRPTSL